MAKLKIYTYPDLVLAQKAEPIARVERVLYKVADDMLETMYDAIGVGLAANQVGILKRILVIDADFDLEELPKGAPVPPGVEVVGNSIIKNKKPRIVINPEIVSREGSVVVCEACLSVPEYSADVKRSEKLVMSYQDIDGVTRKLSAEGLLAIVIQHEMDHLDGKLFIDRLSPLKKEMVRKRLRSERVARESESFDPTALKSSAKKRAKGF
jgi:peptide deformylase